MMRTDVDRAEPTPAQRVAFRTFRADLIVETTMLCDLRCSGCYAPTILSTRRPAHEDAFLPLHSLEQALAALTCDHSIDEHTIIAVRGGEPTLHPAICDVLTLLRGYSANIHLETNGRWILSGMEPLLATCADLGISVKVSFDSMHTVRPAELRQICATLDDHSIQWSVAVTEDSIERAQAIVSTCSWLAGHSVIYQYKAPNVNALSQPAIGVIRPNGQVVSELSIRSSFASAPV